MNRREVRRELRARLAEAEAAAGLDENVSPFCGSCGSQMTVRHNRSGRRYFCSNKECPNSRHPQHESSYQTTYRFMNYIGTMRM